MSRVPPPPPVPAPDTAVRVRRMRAARGACWVIVAALVSGAAFAALDAAARLPGWVRGLGLAVWVTGVGVLGWRLVFRPWQDDPPARPDRQARVELAGNLRATTAAAAAIAGSLLAGAFVPGATEHLRRVALPWQRPVTPYHVVVTSGEPVVARGSVVTLSAYVEKAEGTAPPSAVLVSRDPNGGPEQHTPMTGDGSGAFHATRTAQADFEYRVVCGGAASEWFAVTAVDPVGLADGSATEVVAPKYVPDAAPSVHPGFAALEGLRHATAEFRLRFTRPAADAHLEFRTDAGSVEPTRVALAADGLSGTATFRLRQDGTLRLVAVAERNGRRLRAETGSVGVRVRADDPPRFERLSGVSPGPMTARPGDTLHLAFAATDDVAVANAVFEWVPPGSARPKSVPVPLTGTERAKAGSIDCDLGKFRAGETIRFRLGVSDGRRLDNPPLGPQVATYPTDGWATVRIDPTAAPLVVQEIEGRRDAVRESLDAARRELREAAGGVSVVVEEAGDTAALATENLARLNNARENVRVAAESLRAAGREAGLNPELRPLAESLRSVADGYLKDADDALRRAAVAAPADGAAALAAGAKHLADAVDRLDACAARNDRIARDRLDAHALAALAAEQEVLAAPPAADAGRRQRELLDRLRALLAESAPLRDATAAAKRIEFDRLAASAADLAGLLGDLNAAARELRATARDTLHAAIAREQAELADRAAELLTRIETAARLARVTPPKPQDFRTAAALLADGKTIEALTEMVRLALALESVAGAFEKWSAERADAKVSARQLALWQDDLRTRLRTAVGANPANYATLPAAVRAGFRAEQAALRYAAADLRIPPGEAAGARKAALEHLTAAVGSLDGPGANAGPAMKAAWEELNRLAEKLPAVPERLTKSRAEFDKLYREQESIQTQVEQLVRNADPVALPRKLAALADRQAAQAAAVAALDLPNLTARRARAVAALRATAADLAGGFVHDVPASLAWARREFDRLRGILVENVPPPDERADELVRRLAGAASAVRSLVGERPAFASNVWSFLAHAAEAAAPPPAEKLAPHAAVVQEVARSLDRWPRTPEAAALLYGAQEAVRAADFAFRNGTGPGEIAARLRAAAAELTRFADRLAGTESDHDRLRRLAASRRRAAARARQVAPGAPVGTEAGRQLARELDELAHTRVGAEGQPLKKRMLDLYSRLRDHPAPDRQAGAHAALAEALDELAGLTADVAELAVPPGRADPPEPSPADAYLPSHPLADALRTLAGRYRTARDRVTGRPGEIATWTRPAETNPLAEVERRQRELAADVASLADALAKVAGKLPADPSRAAAEARSAADRFRVGSVRRGLEAGEHAAGVLKALAGSEHARSAAELAGRQNALLAEAGRLADRPGVAAAQQRDLAHDLVGRGVELQQALDSAARDAGDDPAAKTLAAAAAAARDATAKLAEAERKAAAGSTDEAASLRAEADALFRVAGAKAAGAGPATTTLPSLDPDEAVVGEALRRADLAMRRSVAGPDTQPDRAIQRTAAENLRKAARAVRDRLAGGN